MKKATIAMLLICTAVFAQEKGSFTDPRDKKTYKTVKIGKQTWMAQNLDYHGEDGFLGLCYGDDPRNKIKKPENCEKYGRLYDWSEALKACPKGWHLPSDKEWQTLVDFAGGNEVAGRKLKSKSGWMEHDFSGKSLESPKCSWTEQMKEQIDNRGRVISSAGIKEYDKCATDEFGFSALPGGGYFPSFSDGSFDDVGNIGNWWNASEGEGCRDCAYSRSMYYSSEGTGRYSYDKSYLFSVRCVED